MTCEKAIEVMHDIADNEIRYGDTRCQEALDWVEATDVAIKALEKQVPKVACVIFHEPRTICKVARCPACNKRIFGGDFCEHCGQALFWKE